MEDYELNEINNIIKNFNYKKEEGIKFLKQFYPNKKIIHMKSPILVMVAGNLLSRFKNEVIISNPILKYNHNIDNIFTRYDKGDECHLINTTLSILKDNYYKKFNKLNNANNDINIEDFNRYYLFKLLFNENKNFNNIIKMFNININNTKDIGYFKNFIFFNEKLGYYTLLDSVNIMYNNISNFRIKPTYNNLPFFYIETEKYILVSEPPKYMKFNNNLKLHSINGHAIEFNDGLKINLIDGVVIEPDIYNKIFTKNGINYKEIFKLNNQSIKVIIIKNIGWDKIINYVGGKVIDEYITNSKVNNSELTYQVIDVNMINRVPSFRIVKVQCHSTLEEVFLVVPKEKQTETCKGAIAWTFGMTEEEYNPIYET